MFSSLFFSFVWWKRNKTTKEIILFFSLCLVKGQSRQAGEMPVKLPACLSACLLACLMEFHFFPHPCHCRCMVLFVGTIIDPSPYLVDFCFLFPTTRSNTYERKKKGKKGEKTPADPIDQYSRSSACALSSRDGI